MSGNMQAPCETSAWEAAFQLALPATLAPCTVVLDVVFVRRMLPLSLLRHAANANVVALSPSPFFPLVPLRLIALTAALPKLPHCNSSPVPQVFQIRLCGVVEADLELFCNS